ncbi:hypothetical protein TUM4438_40450 [Shewanella sairae]|uniref:Integration host factor subunit beta n=1 Tax=Shewanella sairae TaxID=190310 RepID=A0ABQ4PQD0_9GAMM|nr:HU family DNA-binding protein [Shewanella sairae]MCL1132249.1 HU family DNA-binding protein [Shewanella sairae]GIU51302.1 hypothetical protein TUM4438_40450 [Shewanella sairae]
MTKVYMQDLATHLSDEFRLDFKDADQFVRHARDFFVQSIKANQRIEMRRFGVIKYTTLKAGTSRNPATGQSVEVGERIKPLFAPSSRTTEQL